MRLIFLFVCFVASLQAQNSTVLVIGGGPAGLASAIEAHERGFTVSIIEKRPSYMRMQGVFLADSSIKLLKKWKVDLSPISIITLEDGTSWGFVVLKELEEQLARAVAHRGIPTFTGECVGISSDKKSARILLENREFTHPYDIMVVADGCHSQTRKALGIGVDRFGTAYAQLAVIPVSHEELEVQDAIQKEGVFIKRICTPQKSIIFAQSEMNKGFSIEEMIRACGWQEEVAAIDTAIVRRDIEVVLQQATCFFDSQKEAILIGDAAACASFLEGRGANTAFLTATAAATFFDRFQKQDPNRFDAFNKEMTTLTGELIDTSRYLFTQK